MLEKLKDSKVESGKNPENAAANAAKNAVSSTEIKDAANYGPLPGSSSNVEKYLKRPGGYVYSFGTVLGQAALKLVLGIFGFAKKAIEKKGNLTMKEGYEMGKETFSFENKKEKK